MRVVPLLAAIGLGWLIGCTATPPGFKTLDRPVGGGTLKPITQADVATGPLTGSVESAPLEGWKPGTPTTSLPGPTGSVTVTTPTTSTGATGPTTSTEPTTVTTTPPAPPERPPYQRQPGEVVVYIPEDAREAATTLRRLVADGVPIDQAVAGVIADAQAQGGNVAQIVSEIATMNPDLVQAIGLANQEAKGGAVQLVIIERSR